MQWSSRCARGAQNLIVGARKFLGLPKKNTRLTGSLIKNKKRSSAKLGRIFNLTLDITGYVLKSKKKLLCE